jgi:SNF family Na+-dependent transporter
VQLASKIRNQTPISLASIAFYGIAGIILLVLLPFSGFPPHIGLLGIVSVITAYGLLMRRKWANWLVVALFFVATTFTLYTLYYVIATDAITSVSMIAYAALTWIFTIVVVKNRKNSEI